MIDAARARVGGDQFVRQSGNRVLHAASIPQARRERKCVPEVGWTTKKRSNEGNSGKNCGQVFFGPWLLRCSNSIRIAENIAEEFGLLGEFQQRL